MLLKDKVIVISGVGPGMGQSLARLAAQEGAKVGLGARNKEFIDSVAADIVANGGEAVAVPTDVTSVDQCRALAEATEKAFGKITGLVNSAYMHGEWKPTDEANPDEFAAVFDVNCAGALRMAQACLPSMKSNGEGAIINVSTMSTVNPFPGEGAYSAGKGGMNALTRHMAKDFGRFNIRVNTTRMGWIGGAPVWGHVDREVAAGRDRDEVVGEITQRIPLGIIPPEEDCARAVLFFVSDYSKVVTGGSLDVNGGQYMAP
ncbi:oxidoreductase [Croceicoccus estronivorus]|uniref:SDR family oxidoreductase n=1 Tax=Croceicoccus estronivorus TaxID=1172626 RepID=UPI00082A00BE|nr:SDR family oxidoreductase [Croceicoccus estronivorus]OCC23939.1 oxidoreductase [Croceicoccus estronivorus]